MTVPQERIERIVKFFDRELPKDLQLNKWAYIEDVRACVDSFLCRVRYAKTLEMAELYIEKLNEIRNAI